MKAFKKLAAAAAAITFLLSLSILTADAAEAPKGYSYQVTLHAGNQGTIGGQDSVTISDLQYGAQVSFDLSTIQVTDDRYYVKGVRLSATIRSMPQRSVWKATQIMWWHTVSRAIWWPIP